jgi:hypothetical protein
MRGNPGAKRRPKGRSLRRDERGVAAVEFALIMPVMVVLYFGVVEATRAVRTAQKVDFIAHTMADLAAQKLTNDGSGQVELTDADFDDIFSAAKMMIWPLPTDYLRLEIDQIDSHDNVHFVNPGLPRVDWAVTDNATNYRVCQYLKPSDDNDFGTIPTGLQESGYIVSARVEYNFGAAVLPRFFAKGLTLTRWSFTLPRTQTGFTQLNDINLKATSARVRSKCTKENYETPINTAPTPTPVIPPASSMVYQSTEEGWGLYQSRVDNKLYYSCPSGFQLNKCH